MIRVHIWAEDRPLPCAQEQMRKLYPNGIEGAIKKFLDNESDMTITTATMSDAKQGLSQEILEGTDVLIFWSHKYWRELSDDVVDIVVNRVLEGMGLIVLHSAHASKIFARLMGLCEAGWMDTKRQVGLSGRTVRPKLIITCGVSGAVQFSAGMNNSDCIIAINTDENASIFNFAHYCLVGDLYTIIPELIKSLKGDCA